MMLARRAALGLVGAGLAALPLRAEPPPVFEDEALRDTLDALAARPDPAAGRATLARFDPARLSPSARIDLLTVRAGLAVEARLAALPANHPGRFALQLERACGAAIAPATAERLVQTRITALNRRADQLFRQLGMAPATTAEGFRALLADTRRHYADSDAGRDAAVADMNRWLAAARAALPRWFGPLPPACLDVAVRRMTPAEAASGKGGFRTLPAPGVRGCYTVDLIDIARRPGWTLHSVVHHELLPGHLIQLPVQEAARPHPLRLRYTPGFAEGWAVHAELLAWRGGLLPDAEDELGAIHWLLFRLVRALADTRVNRDGWSADRAAEMMLSHLGFAAYFADPGADAARMAQQPGLRLAEALTALMLDHGAQTSGAIRRFHRTVLANGPRPIRLIGLP